MANHSNDTFLVMQLIGQQKKRPYIGFSNVLMSQFDTHISVSEIDDLR